MDWVNFELGEDIAHTEQDRRWNGAVVDGRKQMSRREECLTYKKEFLGAIYSFRATETLISLLADNSSTLRRLNPDVLFHIVEYAYAGQGALVHSSVSRCHLSWEHRCSNKNKQTTKNREKHGQPFQLYIRKRPLHKDEINQGAYDAVSTDIDGCENSVIVHNGQLERSGRKLTMTHKHYSFSKVLGAEATNAEFCSLCLEPLIHCTLKGLSSTLLCYGQTGTGKTYTLSAALDYGASRFAGHDLEVTFYEIHNNKCYDLLSDRKQVHLRSDERDVVHVRGVNKVSILRAEYNQIKAVFDAGMKLRASEETERNPISSRSHAVCAVHILPQISADEGNGQGSITFVDLAGSERNGDTAAMTAAKHRQSADINYSLMTLKNCFCAYYSQFDEINDLRDSRTLKQRQRLSHRKLNRRIDENMPDGIRLSKAMYRASLLTRILKQCFVLPTESELASGKYHRTAIIATVSPSAADTQHTVNTLDHISLMDPSLQKFVSEVATEVPKSGFALSSTPINLWTSDEVNAWLSTVERGRFAYLAVPPQYTGADLLRLNVNSLSIFFAGQMREARAGSEGEAWTVEGESRRHAVVSRALHAVIRREIELNKCGL